MRKKKERQSKIASEDELVMDLAEQEGNLQGILALLYVREGEILQQLQEIQANSWLR